MRDPMQRVMEEVAQGPAGAVGWAFDAIEVAEEEIAAAWPRRGDEPIGLFLVMNPSPPLLGKSMEIYRAHAQELVARARTSQDLRPATDAEAMCALSALSLRSPLRRHAAELYEELFLRRLPEAAAELGIAARPRVEDGGDRKAREGLLADLRRRFAVPSRVLG